MTHRESLRRMPRAAAALLPPRTLARIDGETVRRVAVVRVDVIVAAPKRHDARASAFERAGVLELLRDDQGLCIGEAEPFEETHVFGVIDAVVEQRAGRQLRRIDDERVAVPKIGRESCRERV